MRVRRRTIPITSAAALGLGATTLIYGAYVSPADVACVFAEFAGLESLSMEHSSNRADPHRSAPGFSNSSRKPERESKRHWALRALTPPSSSFETHDGNDDQLTQHYAFAKVDVSRWLDNVGRDDL